MKRALMVLNMKLASSAKTCKWFEVRHMLGEMSGGRGPEGQASSRVRTGRMLQGRSASCTKRIFVHLYVVAGTISKSGAHNVTLKIEVMLSLLHDA